MDLQTHSWNGNHSILEKSKCFLEKHAEPGIFISLFFNWRIIALQCCVGFCHTSTWISCTYTCVPSLLNLHPTLHPIPLLGWYSTGLSSLCHIANPHWLSIYFYTWLCIYLNGTLSTHPACSFSHCVHKSIIYVCVSIAAPNIGSPMLPFLNSIYIYIMTYNICFTPFLLQSM